ncbi:quinone oxidoreductase family protein [Marinobacter bohaiensis]|uniref:quinone oxidoreductase family protein n=1 Tax=Marinobacter bohaiensis TaxID=2201898 RepID=UPI000DAF25D1|nr:zinc-binding alcohol dehydrogenase family protein [Marinobacter bohaiensis]
MKAIVVAEFGEAAPLAVEERPIPEPREGYSLVRMHAATVNPLSNYIRSGKVPAGPAPLVLSNDGSGIVEQSARFKPGTRVAIYGGASLGITEDGLQQQWVAVKDNRLMPVPDDFSLDAAAALPINFVTAWQALDRVGEAESGQVALVSGASGAVGQALIQLMITKGIRPIAIVSSTQKVETARNAGAETVIDLSKDDLPQRVRELTYGQGADIAFDTIGGDLLGPLLSTLRTRGAVVSIGFAGGELASVDVVDLVVYEKRLLGYDAHLETNADVDAAMSALSQLVAEGLVNPSVDRCFSLERANDAYQWLESRQATGTILLHL